MSKYYEIVVYTASISEYANPLLDILDPNNHINHRLFRDHCTIINDSFVKDLSRLGRDLKNVIIVDNSPLCYGLHPENAIPIETWLDNSNDIMLYQLTPILELLAKVNDVRIYLKKIIDKNGIDYKKAFNVLISEGVSSNLQMKTNSNNRENVLEKIIFKKSPIPEIKSPNNHPSLKDHSHRILQMRMIRHNSEFIKPETEINSGIPNLKSVGLTDENIECKNPSSNIQLQKLLITNKKAVPRSDLINIFYNTSTKGLPYINDKKNLFICPGANTIDSTLYLGKRLRIPHKPICQTNSIINTLSPNNCIKIRRKIDKNLISNECSTEESKGNIKILSKVVSHKSFNPLCLFNEMIRRHRKTSSVINIHDNSPRSEENEFNNYDRLIVKKERVKKTIKRKY